MSDERLTRLERWALAVGAPVIAAGVIATAATLWGLYNSQIRMHHQLTSLVDQAYLQHDAERDLGRVEYRLENLESRTNRIERRVMPAVRREGGP